MVTIQRWKMVNLLRMLAKYRKVSNNQKDPLSFVSVINWVGYNA